MAKAWYQYPFDNPQGAIEPYGGGPKPDSNVQCPDGTPITALLPGTISGLNAPDGSVPAWGAVVTIKLDTPLNDIATHTAYLHLMPLPGNLQIGQRVSTGQLIGWSGGAKAEGAQKVPLGFALYNGDVYGYGPSWNKYVGDPRLNPYGVLLSAQKGKISVPAAFSDGTANPAQVVNEKLAPNADVTTLLYVLDQVLLLNNPFKIDTTGMQDTIAGVSFTDPIAWVNQFGQNVVDDLSAATIRLVFILLGIFVLYKVMSAFIDFGAIKDAALNAGGTVAKAGVIAGV